MARRVDGVSGVRLAALVLLGNSLVVPGALAQVGGETAKPGQGAPSSLPPIAPTAPMDPFATPEPDLAAEKPIISDKDFVAALPELSSDLDAPLEQMQPVLPPITGPNAGDPLAGISLDPITPVAPFDDQGIEAEIAASLSRLEDFEATPLAEDVAASEAAAVTEIKYATRVTGLDELGLEGEFNRLSALKNGDGEADNAAIIGARAREDEGLAVRLLKSLGYYDATATSKIDQTPQASRPVTVTITAVPGPLYRLGEITVKSDPTDPPTLIRDRLKLQTGEPIDAVRILAAEAAVSLALPQNGYPFAEVGQRDILLDDTTQTGDYTLPVILGPRARFRGIQIEGREPVFDAEHIAVLQRFKQDDLYNIRWVDDLRDALIATSLFSNVSIVPVKTGEVLPDGTEYVDLQVTQNKGPARTLAAEGGYSTGQGLRAEVSWTHRNLFPPEGALIVSGVAGTQEQGASVRFRRSNAGRRDRTFELIASGQRLDVDAFTGLTGTLSARLSYDSTPLWQKKLTYSLGVELVGTREDYYDFGRSERRRGTYFIVAAPIEIGLDHSDDLLNPTRGWRVKGNFSPETSVRGSVRPYVRTMVEGTGYYPVMDNLVIAGRARLGTIQGVSRNDLAPSRRFYAGGGGSVRGYGYQDLGPRTPDDKPIGGRSFNEFAIEARYRFGNFGIVPFIDAGQVYEENMPQFNRMRFGAGIGGRFYTSFGPMRLDLATPIGRKDGEPRIALYISIGQAF